MSIRHLSPFVLATIKWPTRCPLLVHSSLSIEHDWVVLKLLHSSQWAEAACIYSLPCWSVAIPRHMLNIAQIRLSVQCLPSWLEVWACTTFISCSRALCCFVCEVVYRLMLTAQNKVVLYLSTSVSVYQEPQKVHDQNNSPIVLVCYVYAQKQV